MQRHLAVLGALILTLTAGGVQADVLLLDGIEAERAALAARPSRGMSMQAVEQRFGTPQRRVSPVGEPPIARWEYPEFIVYFEHHLVIHAAGRRPQE